jgi:hypothetical protein
MANRTLMLGSEVDLWGEGADDNNLFDRLFPAVNAVSHSHNYILSFAAPASAATGTCHRNQRRVHENDRSTAAA